MQGFVLDFEKPQKEVSITPEVARGVAEEIARKAHIAQFKGLPMENQLIEQKRLKLLRRIELMIVNLTNRKVKPQRMAQEIVDTVFHEVL